MKFFKGLLVSLLSLILFGAISALGFAFMLNQTVMDPNFTAAEVDKMDMAAVASAIIQVPDSGNNANTFIPATTVNAAITSSIKAAEPELKSELRTALFSTYDYFLGRSDSLNISISLDSVKNNLNSTLWTYIQKSPPSQIPSAQLQSYFNSYFDQSFGSLLSPIKIDSGKFDASTKNTTQQIKQYIAYYQFWWVTIPLILVLAVAIILLENNLRHSLRDLGINLFLFGALGIVSDYLLNRYATPSTVIPGLPAAVSSWLNGFLNDVAAPLNTFSIAVAVIGVVLFVVSFFMPKKEPVTTQN